MTALTIARHEHYAHGQFHATQGVIDGSHLVLSGGSHSELYLNADRVFPDAKRMVPFYRHWKGHFFDGKGGKSPEVIAGPATGGVYLVGGFSQFLYAHNIKVGAVWADKEGKEFLLERSRFAATVRGKRVLVVEDVITSGTSTMKTITAVQAAGGIVVGVACMANRRARVTAETLGVPDMKVCWQLDVPDFPADACPFCAEGRPIVTNIGHGATFQTANPEYSGGFTELMFDD
jgi:orotate phosphoribosyltransferase